MALTVGVEYYAFEDIASCSLRVTSWAFFFPQASNLLHRLTLRPTYLIEHSAGSSQAPRTWSVRPLHSSDR